MARTLVVGREGDATEAEELVPPAQGEFRWVDLTRASDAELEALGAAFRFHPLSLDDVRSYDQRPKLEEFSDHLFVVIHRLRLERAPLDVTSSELHAFVSERYLVTAHAEGMAELDAVRARVAANPELARRGPAFWLYLLSDALASSSIDEIELLGSIAESIEVAVLSGKSERVLERLLETKRALASARRLVSPQRDVFASLAKLGSAAVPDRTAVYFRNVYDSLVRAVETLDAQRELASTSIDAHFSMLSQRTNEIVKHLTLLSSIFLPLTFVTGFFGQNFEHLPFQSDALMWAGIASCVALPTGMLTWFRFKRWL